MASGFFLSFYPPFPYFSSSVYLVCIAFFHHSFIFVFSLYFYPSRLRFSVIRSAFVLRFFLSSFSTFFYVSFLHFFRALCPSLLRFLTLLSFPNQLRSPRRPELQRNESEGRPSGGSSPGIACREGHLLRGSRRLGRRWDPNVFPVSKIHVFN